MYAIESYLILVFFIFLLKLCDCENYHGAESSNYGYVRHNAHEYEHQLQESTDSDLSKHILPVFLISFFASLTGSLFGPKKAPTNKCTRANTGVLLAGGRNTNPTLAEAFYNPTTNTICNLPPLAIQREGSITNGFTVCGGLDLALSTQTRTCETFDPRSGTWSTSHILDIERTYATSWQSSEGLFIMGGMDSSLTTTKISNGVVSPGFNLMESSFFSCAIEDPNTDSVYIIGGSTSSGQQISTVTRYGVNGFIENLPDINYARIYSGCTSYYDEDQNLVLLVVGGLHFPDPLVRLTTERFVVGVDTAWTVVDETYGFEDNSCVNPDCQPFCFQGLNGYNITKYDKMTNMWDEVLTVDYWRAYFGNFASLVPLDSGVDNWCMTTKQLQQGTPNTYQDGDRNSVLGSDRCKKKRRNKKGSRKVMKKQSGRC